MATVTETFVKSTDDATATTHTVTAVTIAAGKLAILRFGYQSDTVTISSVADNAGNTWSTAVSVHSASGDNQTSAISYLVVPAGGLSGATITITLSATATLAADLTYFDSDTGWPAQGSVLDKTSGNNTGLVTSWTSNATATTTQADELLTGVAYSGGAINGGTSSASGGWTEEQEHVLTHGYELITEWQHVTSTGAYAATGTWSAAEIAACCIATFKTAAGAVAGGVAPFRPLLSTLHTFSPLRVPMLGFPAPVAPVALVSDVTVSVGAATALGLTPTSVVQVAIPTIAPSALGLTGTQTVNINAVIAAALGIGLSPQPTVLVVESPVVAGSAGVAPAPSVLVVAPAGSANSIGSAPGASSQLTIVAPASTATGQTAVETTLVTIPIGSSAAVGSTPAPTVITGSGTTVQVSAALALGSASAPIVLITKPVGASTSTGTTIAPGVLATALVTAALAAGLTPNPTVIAGQLLIAASLGLIDLTTVNVSAADLATVAVVAQDIAGTTEVVVDSATTDVTTQDLSGANVTVTDIAP